ncbi:Ubiquitin carboxyl-terminal hydrolase 16 [Apostasia shenzhenica]|uniref:Ubiquitin carboxyl-terminal hydrolase 16 n=1 Tax=Apostasia shenzhenica TaxID=1088818 RepID=A0A2I0AKN3_9ASPA|nr:Ubiquitin carboxyl-terminal hydrolase 16 [Apostasia shenzhenica]
MGWTGALLVVITAVFPALALVVRRKWRLAEVRRAEVLRLVRLAAAEAERAEREAASFAYVAEEPISAVSSGGMGMQHCAVCYCPTTTRCSRCKAVRYCSGSCQIIHWRQGHKDKCYPPLFDDQHEGQSNALATHLRGEQVEISEISENGSGYTKQSVSNVQGEKIQSSVIGNSRLEFGGKSDDTKCMKESFKTAIPVEANQTAEVHSNIGKLEENHLLNPSGDISATSEGPCSSRPVEIPDDVLSNNDLAEPSPQKHAEPSPQKHADRSTSEALESNSPTNSYSIPRTSVTDADWINHKNHSEDKTSMTSLDHSSSSRSMKVDCQNVDGEEHKLSVPSNMNSSNPSKLMDAMDRETTNKYKPMDSVNIDKCEISQISQICSRSQREIQSVLTENTKSSNSTESQICDDNHPPELGTVLPSELTVKVSSLKSNSRTAASVRSETEKTTSLVTGKLGEVSSLENNNEHLKSLYSTRLEDSLAHGQSISRNASLSVDKVPSISIKLPNINASSSNVKMPGKIAAQEMTSFSLSRHNQSTAYCGSGKYNYKVLFPYDNFIRLYNSDKVEMLPCGLINCGNSAWHLHVHLLHFFLMGSMLKHASLRKDRCFTCEFESLLAKMKLGRSPISPAGIIFHLKDIGSNFGHGREEDAHEFLRYAIDAMQSACLKEACASSYSDLAPETTIIQLIFGGYLRSKIKCMRCQGKSEHRERMMDLTVDVHGDTGTLEEALARFTATEVLEGENKYKCDRCKSYEQAKKQLTILEAPNVLTIALKRYQYGKYDKLNKMVRFPEYLNLAPYMRSSDDNSPVYRLYAVVVHKNNNNTAFSGHYVCYVKNTRGKWFKADDSMVKEVELQKVLSQSAYMLLYARCSPRAPSLLRKEMAKKMKQKECTDARLNSVFSHSGFASPEHRAPNRTTHRTLDPSNFGPHDLFDERFRRPKADSSSDSSSLFSCSDEGSSWSTESSKDSAVSELESTHISLDSPQRFSNELDSTSLGLNGSNKLKRDSGIGEDGFQAFLYSTKEYRNLTEQCSSRREADLVNPSQGVSRRRRSDSRIPDCCCADQSAGNFHPVDLLFPSSLN